MPAMRALLNAVCGITVAASVWLGVMFVVLHRPEYERGVAMSMLFVLQSLLALAVANVWLSGVAWRVAATAGAAGLVWAGISAVVGTISGSHFEGYALILGLLLILQGLLTVTQLIRPSSPLRQKCTN